MVDVGGGWLWLMVVVVCVCGWGGGGGVLNQFDQILVKVCGTWLLPFQR